MRLSLQYVELLKNNYNAVDESFYDAIKVYPGIYGGILMKGMGNMMKQAQKLQASMMKLQEELAERTVETTSGGGMVKVVANGKQQIVSIEMEKEVVDPEDVEMLQDLILAAINDALAKSQEMVSSEMSKLTGGINIPGLT
jgi:DNA-binding YbaB/EbfC family protein